MLQLLAQSRSAAELQQALGVSKQAVHEILGKMLKSGRVLREPTGTLSHGSMFIRSAE